MVLLLEACINLVTVLLEDHDNTSLFEAPPSPFNDDESHLEEANLWKIGQSLSPKVPNKRPHFSSYFPSALLLLLLLLLVYKLRKKERSLLLQGSMERKELPAIDFSSYFYFEASGDSEEADCEIARADGDGDGDDDDDALSCNYDGSGACNATEFDGDEEKSCDEEHDDNEKKEEDEEKSGVYGMSYCEDDEVHEEQMKSYVSFDSGQEVVDEMEKNRLFWEACLAS